MTIIKYDKLNPEDINYSIPEKLGSSYFGSFSFGETLQPLYIQTPKLKTVTNIGELKDKKNPFLEVEIPSTNFDLYDLFLSIDDQNIKKTLHQSEEWFQKEIPLESIDDMYKRTTKPFKKGESPTLRFRLPLIKNKIECTVYNQQRVFVDVEEIKENMDVILILHLRGLKFLKHNFYCDCYVSQIKLFQDSSESKYNIIQEYSLIEDEEEGEKNINYNDIFNEEITNAFKQEEKQKAEELKQKEEKQKAEELKKGRIKQLKQKEERIKQLKEEIENENNELKKLEMDD